MMRENRVVVTSLISMSFLQEYAALFCFV